MIKINLLPLESFRQTASGQLAVTIFFLGLVATGIALYLFNTTVMVPKSTELTATKDAATKELSELKMAVGQALKQTTDFVHELVQVASIADLEERRRDQARLFMSLAGNMINQSSWMISCSHLNGTLSVKGLATDNETVAVFLDNLERSPLLSEVSLTRAADDASINGIRLVSFEIKANTSFPQSSLLTQGLPNVNFPNEEDVKKIVQAAAPNLLEYLDRNKEIAKAL
jgi:type IV pilus assembly protein PilN